MDHKLTTLLSTIASLSEEDVQKLFIEVSKFPAIHACLITRDSSKEDGSCNERFEKTDKDAYYVLESETEAFEEECREPIAPQA